MRIARYDRGGQDGWALVETDKAWPLDGDWSLHSLLLTAPSELVAAKHTVEPVALSSLRLLAPIAEPPQFLGVGLNYRDHANETGLDIPSSPMGFGLLASAIIGPGTPIELPSVTDQVDWEAELGVVIGRGGRDIRVEDAMEHVAGYVIVNDVSARDLQTAEGQFTRAKSLDTFKPMGPWIVTADELGPASQLSIRLWVNDELKQDSSTRELIFGVPELVSRLSASLTLQTGSVIATGTPHGVGGAREPAEFLRPGDEVTIEIEGIGRLTNPVVGTS